jgi:hypothetical protein
LALHSGDVTYGVVLGAAAVALAVVSISLYGSLRPSEAPPIAVAALEAPPPQVACPPDAPAPSVDATPERMTLSVDVEPNDALLTIFVDGQPLTTGTGDERAVVTGTATTEIDVYAHAPGHARAQQRVAFDPTGSRLRIALTPEATPTAKPSAAPTSSREAAGLATLRIGTERGTRPAKVVIDGDRIGMTPIASHRVAAGSHRVTWHWDDGTTQTQTVKLAAGEAQTLRGG